MRINKLAAIEKEINKLVGSNIKVGIFDKKIAEYGVYNEYGTEHIPARSFMRSTEREQKGWAKDIAKVYDEVIYKNGAAKNMLKSVGEKVQQDIKDKILSNVPPPNAPATLRQKRGNKTLIDTGAMLNSISYKVIKDV